MGLAIYAYYTVKKCDPYQAGLISNRNQIAPFFVLHAMTTIPGMAGLFMGVLCCGSLSSLSSGINSMAVNTVQDILRRPLMHMNETTITFITKLLVLSYGMLAIGLAFFTATYLHGPAPQMAAAVFGALGSPIMGIIVMGASVPWANKYGAFSGVVVSLCLNLWISIGSVNQGTPLKALPPITTENCYAFNSSILVHLPQGNMTSMLDLSHRTNSSNYEFIDTTMNVRKVTATIDSNDTFFLYDITYEWYPIIGCSICIFVGLVVSLLASIIWDGTSHCSLKLSTTDAKYIYPVLRGYWAMEVSQNIKEPEESDYGNKNDHDLYRECNAAPDSLEMKTACPLLTKSAVI